MIFFLFFKTNKRVYPGSTDANHVENDTSVELKQRRHCYSHLKRLSLFLGYFLQDHLQAKCSGSVEVRCGHVFQVKCMNGGVLEKKME